MSKNCKNEKKITFYYLLDVGLIFIICWINEVILFGDVENYPSIFFGIVWFHQSQMDFSALSFPQTLSWCQNPLVSNERSTTFMGLRLRNDKNIVHVIRFYFQVKLMVNRLFWTKQDFTLHCKFHSDLDLVTFKYA